MPQSRKNGKVKGDIKEQIMKRNAKCSDEVDQTAAKKICPEDITCCWCGWPILEIASRCSNQSVMDGGK